MRALIMAAIQNESRVPLSLLSLVLKPVRCNVSGAYTSRVNYPYLSHSIGVILIYSRWLDIPIILLMHNKSWIKFVHMALNF